MLTTWSERLLDVAFVLCWCGGVLAIIAHWPLDLMPVTMVAAGMGIVAGLIALPGVVRGERPWWLRRRVKR